MSRGGGCEEEILDSGIWMVELDVDFLTANRREFSRIRKIFGTGSESLISISYFLFLPFAALRETLVWLRRPGEERVFNHNRSTAEMDGLGNQISPSNFTDCTDGRLGGFWIRLRLASPG